MGAWQGGDPTSSRSPQARQPSPPGQPVPSVQPVPSAQPVVVSLEAWEYEHALDVGTRRFTANWGKADAPHYDKARMEDDRTAQQAACVAELAVAKHTNRYWPGHVWHASEHARHRHVADVGENIEVRRVRRRDRDAAVRRHQVGTGLVLWVCFPVPPEFREVEMWGWLPYDLAWERGVVADYDKRGTTRTVPRHLLRTDLPRLTLAAVAASDPDTATVGTAAASGLATLGSADLPGGEAAGSSGGQPGEAARARRAA